MGESGEKQGAETPEDAGIHEGNPPEGSAGGSGRTDSDTVFIKEVRKGGDERGAEKQKSSLSRRYGDFMARSVL